MNFYNIFLYLSLILTLTVTIAYSLAENSNQVSLYRVKRKGRRSGGGSRSSGRSSGKSKTRIAPASAGSYPKQPSSHVDAGGYPKQPAYNPNYNPGGTGHVQTGQHSSNIGTAGGYPKQPAYNPNYNHGGAQYPQQPGHFPSSYGQPAHNYGHGGYGQTGYVNSGARTGGFGGVGTGLAAGALGAAVGAYGGYQLGKMVGHSGLNGHYGYYDSHYHYVKCPPPPKIEFDPKTNITYIPMNVTYDVRCSYYDREPPKVHPIYNQLNNSQGFYTIYTNSSGNYTGHWPINSVNSTGLATGPMGATMGAYGSYKLGRMVGQSGLNGSYGYYDNQYRYVKCPPPPKIEFDSKTNMSYIPLNITYDDRCSYFDRQPPKIHPFYSQQNSSTGFYSGFTNSSVNYTGQTSTTSQRILVMTRHYGNNNWKRSSAPPLLPTTLFVIISALVFDINILYQISEFFN